jgi:glycosyltransferase involved in cell wall biosynthesis
MRVLIVSTLYPPIVQGGAEKAAAHLAEALASAGEDVAVISLHPGPEPVEEERNGVRVYRLPLDNLYWPFSSDVRPHAAHRLLWHLRDAWNWRAARRVAAILDRERPDVMHTHSICGFSIAIWNEARKRGIRLVHTTHDYYLLCLRSDMFPQGRRCDGNCLKCRLGTVGRRYWSSKLDAIISVSQFVLATHRSRGYFQCVDASVSFNVSPPLHDAGKLALPAEDDRFVFGFIGRVEEQKGIHVLLEATRMLTRSHWRLRVAGRGRAAFVAQLRQRFPDPRIEWLGYTDADSFYPSIHLIVLPSVWSDPLPFVAIESLERGKGMIAARSGGIPEIACLGRVVATYPAENRAALASLMDEAMARPDRWRTGGFADIATARMFCADRIVAQHQATYASRSNRSQGLLTSGASALAQPVATVDATDREA